MLIVKLPLEPVCLMKASSSPGVLSPKVILFVGEVEVSITISSENLIPSPDVSSNLAVLESLIVSVNVTGALKVDCAPKVV